MSLFARNRPAEEHRGDILANLCQFILCRIAAWALIIWFLLTMWLPSRASRPLEPADAMTATPSRAWSYFLPSVSEPLPDTVTYTELLVRRSFLPDVQANRAPTATLPAPTPTVTPPPNTPALPTATPLPSLAPALSAGQEPGVCAGFVGRAGEQLVLDGQPFTFVGANVSYLLEDYFPEEQVPAVVAYLAESGATALRVWLFPQHNQDRAERLFDLGREYHIRFVVTLVNYYFDKGSWWFSSEHYTREYLPHVQKAVARFHDRPEIMMWELMNEPNCSGDTLGTCPAHMVAWAETVSKEIKALAPCHLVTTGTIRIDPTEEHYRQLHALPDIDVVSIHKAADLWLEGEIRVAHELDKPVLIGEIHAIAYDAGCHELHAGVLDERAKVIAADMDRAWAQGVDGYLLWEYGHGRVVVGEQESNYCGGHDYMQGDPVWGILQAAPVTRGPAVYPDRD